MLLGLVAFVWGKPLLEGAGEPPNPSELAVRKFMGLSTEWLIYVLTFVGVGVLWFLIRDEGAVKWVLYSTFAVVYLYIILSSVLTLPPHPRNRIFAALILISVQVLFWALFEQAGSSLSLFTDRSVDRTIFGQEIKTSVFQSLNAMYIVLLGPLFAAFWVWLGKRNLDPSAPAKFGLGIIQLGLGFLVLVWGANAAGSEMTPVIFIFLIYLLHTTGELCLSPVGLSAMTRLSVPKMVGLIMGAWFLASGFGNFAAAQIAKLTTADGGGADQVILVYSSVGKLAVGVGIVLILISPFIKKMMHLDTIATDNE